jgi:outer membrane protein assembly factor BamB
MKRRPPDNRTLSRRWIAKLYGGNAPPAVASGTIIAADDDCAMCGFDAATGEIRWRHPLQRCPKAITKPPQWASTATTC